MDKDKLIEGLKELRQGLLTEADRYLAAIEALEKGTVNGASAAPEVAAAPKAPKSGKRGPREMSPEARERISKAMKKRWKNWRAAQA